MQKINKDKDKEEELRKQKLILWKLVKIIF